MRILGLHTGHNAAVSAFDDYDLLAAIEMERITRTKGDGRRLPRETIAETLDVVGWRPADVEVVCTTRGGFPPSVFSSMSPVRKALYSWRRLVGREPKRNAARELMRAHTTDTLSVIDRREFLAMIGLSADADLLFCNHHDAHVYTALFHTLADNVLVYTADGFGDNIFYSFYHLKDGALHRLYGGDGELLKPTPIDSMGQAYERMTRALGFIRNRHEGKVTGLAAYGQPIAFDRLRKHFRVSPDGRVHSDFASYQAMDREIQAVAKTISREDAAASIQALLEAVVLASVKALLERTGARYLALAGGVFANVRLNRLLCEATGVDGVFIYPAMGDNGMPVGATHQYLIERDGLETWLGKRRPLKDVYLGRHYENADAVLAAGAGVRRIEGEVAKTVARLCMAGYVGAIFSQRMEYGPRALGARSIVGSPADAAINDNLNKRLNRSEFMPFAPVVLAEDARRVFAIDDRNEYACRFMTITVNVKDEWRSRIPAVVHVDGTARPQIVTDEINPTYAATVRAFRDASGLPVMINTSFNAHEEPIIDTPEQCLKALLDDRIDFVFTDIAVYAVKDLTPR